MTHNTPSDDKNPLHAHALTVADLQPGRHILLFNMQKGIYAEAIVIDQPTYGYIGDDKAHPRPKYLTEEPVVKLEDQETRRQANYSLCSLGVIPYVGALAGWSDGQFVVDNEHRDTLPVPDPLFYKPIDDAEDEAIFGEYMRYFRMGR